MADDDVLILVDENDREVGYESKERCHDGEGLLHRAFSVFLFDEKGLLLLQQRSPLKRLWPLYWSNTCCSHPRRGENVTIAATRRLHEELGLSSVPDYVFKFRYHAAYSGAGAEHELCYVYIGRLQGALVCDRKEIVDTRLLSLAQLEDEIKRNPEQFTPWLKLELRQLLDNHRDVLLRYTKLS